MKTSVSKVRRVNCVFWMHFTAILSHYLYDIEFCNQTVGWERCRLENKYRISAADWGKRSRPKLSLHHSVNGWQHANQPYGLRFHIQLYRLRFPPLSSVNIGTCSRLVTPLMVIMNTLNVYTPPVWSPLNATVTVWHRRSLIVRWAYLSILITLLWLLKVTSLLNTMSYLIPTTYRGQLAALSPYVAT